MELRKAELSHPFLSFCFPFLLRVDGSTSLIDDLNGVSSGDSTIGDWGSGQRESRGVCTVISPLSAESDFLESIALDGDSFISFPNALFALLFKDLDTFWRRRFALV